MRIYFMGICGTAMGNAALLIRETGHQVLGADTAAYPPMSAVLAAAGIELHEGYDPARLARLAPDLVVIGNAMTRGNPEIEWLLATRAHPITSLPALLHDHILARRDNIVICGTHGKTTTTALTAHLLRENGLNPGYLIGGVPQDPPTGNHLGAPDAPFVIEGDEYDSAFFDKRSKFIHYAPRIAILNNLEFDHADIFRDLADVKRTFAHLTRLVPRNGHIIANGDDPNVLEVIENVTWCPILRVGTTAPNDIRIADFTETPAGITFTLHWKNKDHEPTKIQMPLPGHYNARNAAMACVTVALVSGSAKFPLGGRREAPPNPTPPSANLALPTLHLAAPLSHFRGVRRRQETLVTIPALTAAVAQTAKSADEAKPRLIENRESKIENPPTPSLTVIEDFAHHPTAIAETLKSLRNRYPNATLTAAFEPRSNTARTRALQTDFAAALAHADEVYLGPVNRAEKLPPADRLDTDAIVRTLSARNIRAESFPTNAALLEKLTADTLPPAPAPSRPRVVIFFSNGNFDGIIAKYAAQAR